MSAGPWGNLRRRVRRDPRLIAVPVVLSLVAVTWVAAATLPTPAGSAASKSSVIAVSQQNLICPQAGGAVADAAAAGGPATAGTAAGAAATGTAVTSAAAGIAYADSATTTPPTLEPAVSGSPIASPLASSLASPSASAIAAPVASAAALVPAGSAAKPAATTATPSASAKPTSTAPASSAPSGIEASLPASAAPASSAPAASAGASSASGSTSDLNVSALGPDAVSAPVVAQPGHAWTVAGPSEQGPVQVAVNGPLTSTLGVTQFTRTSVGAVSQLAVAPCTSPTTDAWFAGFSSEVGDHATLLLSNVDSVPASVDVTVWGGQGGEPDAKRGIRVDAQTQVAVSLDELEPSLTAAAAHVVATAGRIVPAVRFDAEDGSIPLGVDWLPETAAPGVTQTVPGIVGGNGTRTLVVANPGDLDASYALNVVTSQGAFVPTELSALTVKAGEVAEVGLDAILQGQPAAIVVTSDQPVVVGASASLPPDAGGASDIAFTGAVPALQGPTIVPGGEVSTVQHTELIVSAPGDDASLTVTILPSSAASAAEVFPELVPGGTTALIDIGSLASDPAPGVVVTPTGGGPIYAAWTLAENGTATVTGDLTEIAMSTPARSLLRPPVAFDPAAGLP